MMRAGTTAFAWPPPQECYAALMAGAAPTLDAFDAHVLACILTIAAEDARRGTAAFIEAIGLHPLEFAALLRECFPDVSTPFQTKLQPAVQRVADEDCLVDLLRQAASTPLGAEYLAAMVARRAQRPDHLWQDLGLRARTELSRLMLRHFRVLAVRNTRDMKWKRYLYRTICGEIGYTLCTAPSCSE